jgi:hypothetical protein
MDVPDDAEVKGNTDMKSILSKIILVGAAAAAIAVPATAASASAGSFAAQDNAGLLVTSQPLAVGQMVAHEGFSGTITHVQDDGGHYIFRMTTALPASDNGKTLTFTVR